MNDSPRGTYTPQNDQPLSFDARAPVRGSRPVPMTLIVSAVILVTLIVAIFLIYRGGVRGAGDAPQPVGQVVGDIKAAAPPENRPADPAAGLQIYRGDAPPPAAAAFTPPPETPAARPTTPIAAADPIGAALESSEAAAAKPAAVAKPAAPAAPVAVKTPAAPAAVAKPVAKPVVVATAAGGSLVQIGAFSSEALAEQGWKDAAKIAPGLAAGKGKSVTAVDAQGKTLYRTAVTGFASKDQADAFCNALKAAGKSCFTR